MPVLDVIAYMQIWAHLLSHWNCPGFAWLYLESDSALNPCLWDIFFNMFMESGCWEVIQVSRLIRSVTDNGLNLFLSQQWRWSCCKGFLYRFSWGGRLTKQFWNWGNILAGKTKFSGSLYWEASVLFLGFIWKKKKKSKCILLPNLPFSPLNLALKCFQIKVA